MFMVQSIAPIAAPNTNSTRPRLSGSGATASAGRVRPISSIATTITLRAPWRAASAPAMGMASSEPAPRHSSTMPSMASSSPARALAKGTIGAHAEMAKPGTKNAARVACCWASGLEGTGQVPAGDSPALSPARAPRRGGTYVFAAAWAPRPHWRMERPAAAVHSGRSPASRSCADGAPSCPAERPPHFLHRGLKRRPRRLRQPEPRQTRRCDMIRALFVGGVVDNSEMDLEQDTPPVHYPPDGGGGQPRYRLRQVGNGADGVAV